MSDRQTSGLDRTRDEDTSYSRYDELDDQFDRYDLRRKREQHPTRSSPPLTKRERDERWPIG